jgi:AraC-like DNA-binding protein
MASTRGILVPGAIDARFTLTRHAPCAGLAEIVERYWIVRWTLAAPHAQETLPHPNVNVVVGTHQPGVHGPRRRRFVAELEGEGWVVGAKIRPGAFRAFVDVPMVELAERTWPVARVFPGLAAEVAAAACDEERIARLEAVLASAQPVLDDDMREANRIVALAQAEPSIARVAELAARARMPVRTMERLFRTHVGVTPKWVVRRYRVHEAAERVARGDGVEWSLLANELGYADQSHLIRDFKAQIGRTPAQYAAECRSACAPAAVRTDRPRRGPRCSVNLSR